MGSPRYWNVERHIWRLHGGLGEPVNEFGKIRKQCQIEMNLQYGHGYQNTDPQLAPLSHNQVKDIRASATDNYGMDNSNNSKRWDFIDEAIEPVKKLLEFNQVLARLSTLSQQYSYHSPSAIAYEYPLLLSTPMNRSNLRAMNIGNNSANRSFTNESNNNKRIAQGGTNLKTATCPGGKLVSVKRVVITVWTLVGIEYNTIQLGWFI
ncbi:MAG TPA: hypothetical protein VE223_02715 [Nitrososphaeraceae archaeon]|nr:hypothetical protein [Nitrososphaeraceae archaeon]